MTNRIVDQSPAIDQPPSPNGDGEPDGQAEREPPATQDIFADIAALRLSQDYASTIGVRKALLTVPIRKPAKEWFIRTHQTMRIETCVLELKEDRETYLVAPTLWPELAAESTFGPRHCSWL